MRAQPLPLLSKRNVTHRLRRRDLPLTKKRSPPNWKEPLSPGVVRRWATTAHRLGQTRLGRTPYPSTAPDLDPALIQVERNVGHIAGVGLE